jgi:dienelactone hydrolase
MKKLIVGMALFLSLPVFAATSTPVKVQEGTRSFQGDLYVPDHPKADLPLIVVVHEWWGNNDYPKMRAKRIADELGYAALSVDLYGGKVATNVKDAQDLSGPFYKTPELGVDLLKKFIDATKAANPSIDYNKIAAIGYCFGGTQALNLARSGHLPAGEKLLGVVSFHGGLASSLKAKGPIEPKLLVLHGGADKMVTPKDVAAFKTEMKEDHADMTFKAYPGAMHAFTNPDSTANGKKFGIPIAYNEKADHDSWNMMSAFFTKIFQ